MKTECRNRQVPQSINDGDFQIGNCDSRMVRELDVELS